MISQDDIDAFQEYNPEAIYRVTEEQAKNLDPDHLHNLILVMAHYGKRLTSEQLKIAYETRLTWNKEHNQ